MATYLDIQNRVKTRLIDLPSTTLAEVPVLINDALRELQSRHNFWVMRKTLAANTVALTRNLVATPSDFKEFRLEPYYTENSGFKVPMRIASSRRQVNGIFEDDDDGPPRFILRGEPSSEAGASSLEVWPLSDGQSDWSAVPSGEYRVTIPYFGYVPALSANSDTNWFTNNALGEHFLINQAVAMGFAINWDLEKETEWLSLADGKYKLLVAEDKRGWLAGVETFTPHKGAWWNKDGE